MSVDQERHVPVNALGRRRAAEMVNYERRRATSRRWLVAAIPVSVFWLFGFCLFRLPYPKLELVAVWFMGLVTGGIYQAVQNQKRFFVERLSDGKVES